MISEMFGSSKKCCLIDDREFYVYDVSKAKKIKIGNYDLAMSGCLPLMFG